MRAVPNRLLFNARVQRPMRALPQRQHHRWAWLHTSLRMRGDRWALFARLHLATGGWLLFGMTLLLLLLLLSVFTIRKSNECILAHMQNERWFSMAPALAFPVSFA